MNLAKPLFLRRVVGSSMQPTLLEGQVVLASSLKTHTIGSLVIARVDDRQVVKRIDSINKDRIVLKGDNRLVSSNYSIENSQILGTIIR